MIGSRKPKRAVYSGADPGIEILLRDLVGPSAVAEDQARARSDHVAFQAAGIPVGGLFTGAGKPWDACYHRACDTRLERQPEGAAADDPRDRRAR